MRQARARQTFPLSSTNATFVVCCADLYVLHMRRWIRVSVVAFASAAAASKATSVLPPLSGLCCDGLRSGSGALEGASTVQGFNELDLLAWYRDGHYLGPVER